MWKNWLLKINRLISNKQRKMLLLVLLARIIWFNSRLTIDTLLEIFLKYIVSFLLDCKYKEYITSLCVCIYLTEFILKYSLEWLEYYLSRFFYTKYNWDINNELKYCKDDRKWRKSMRKREKETKYYIILFVLLICLIFHFKNISWFRWEEKKHQSKGCKENLIEKGSFLNIEFEISIIYR